MTSSNDHMAPERVLRLFLGLCKAVEAFHMNKPEPLAHRFVHYFIFTCVGLNDTANYKSVYQSDPEFFFMIDCAVVSIPLP